MREAILKCAVTPYGCGAVYGNAYCPYCGSQLEYKSRDRAQCSNPDCGETWHPVNLKKTCRNCGRWDLHFST